jgi:K+-transporting ATPase ATPase A chain
MTFNGWLQILFYFALVVAVTKPLGAFMTRVFERKDTVLDPALRPVEKLIYRITGVDQSREMRWTEYAAAMLLFSLASMLALYVLQRVQYYLPLNPQGLKGVAAHTAFNTAASFTTNTNWQSYTPESTMSYLTQMAGLAVQNFVSAAVGIALAIAFIRGIARRESATIGNFWVDITRASLWVLLPFCLAGALLLVAGGVPQNLRPYDRATLLDPPAVGSAEQVIAQGPVASQEIIKQWGTNGGGFFAANSAHPFENPTPWTNLIGMFGILAVSGGLTYTLGRMTGSPRHGWAVFGAMALLFIAGVVVCYWAEARGNPLFAEAGAGGCVMERGGNMEGKEVRFGIANSALWATITTNASCGAVNSMHDSFTPLGGLVPLSNILIGEVIFGGVGAGLYGILIYVILTVFIAGLMVGRTPEYLGKKIEAYEVRMAMLNLLVFPLAVLAFTAISAIAPEFGASQTRNAGPHGLTEMLYAFASGAGNNGSAFAGLSADTWWYNTAIGASMLCGRFLMIIPMLALAGSLAAKKAAPPSPGTFPVTTPLFVVLLVSVIVMLGALTFLPVLSLGPIVEHLLMQSGGTF